MDSWACGKRRRILRWIPGRVENAGGTVKGHAHGIYGKLGVQDRWSAVDKARGLGILA